MTRKSASNQAGNGNGNGRMNRANATARDKYEPFDCLEVDSTTLDVFIEGALPVAKVAEEAGEVFGIKADRLLYSLNRLLRGTSGRPIPIAFVDDQARCIKGLWSVQSPAGAIGTGERE